VAGALVGFSGSAHKPAQRGRVSGTDVGTGAPLSRSVEWQFDTGSDLCVLPERIANLFQLRPAGVGSAGQGLGGGALLLARRGLTVEFEVEDASGAAKQVAQPFVVYIGGNIPIVGMHVLAVTQTALSWDPRQSSGKLTAP
jgi:hypothetical protein